MLCVAIEAQGSESGSKVADVDLNSCRTFELLIPRPASE